MKLCIYKLRLLRNIIEELSCKIVKYDYNRRLKYLVAFNNI